MSRLNLTGQRVVPYAGHKFRIKEIGGDYFFAVNQVTALSQTIEVTEYREGGDPSLMRKSPGQSKYEAITMERGVTNNPQFEQWANKVWNYGEGLGAEFKMTNSTAEAQGQLVRRQPRRPLTAHPAQTPPSCGRSGA
jgi:hypothetical protein